MDGVLSLKFKIASEPWEFEQIHRLNYKTFVEEIPQHNSNNEGILVDKFHDQNTYVICLQGRQLIGMMALRAGRPFSLDAKLPDLEQYLPSGARKIAEIRLLALEKEHRGGRIFLGLLKCLAEYLVVNGYDLAIISGTTRQLRLYKHMGFVPFGPLVGTPGAMYQPMYLTRDRFKETARALLPEIQSDDGFGAVSFLPGPVDLTMDVRRTFSAVPISHRGDAFLQDFAATRQALRKLLNARNVEILTGSGTLANDVVAAQISLEKSRGLVLSNGEFGDRLTDHAGRMKLNCTIHRRPWGSAFDLSEIEQALDADPSIGWMWAVHCETSTGVLNDLSGLKAICLKRGIKLCLDCISSIGTVSVDLSGVYLASGISGKGLRGFPGLCLVFQDHPIRPVSQSLPRYLDLGFYAAKDGVPFTLCSNLLYALKTAIDQIRPAERFEAIARHSRYIRQRLAEMNLPVLAPPNYAAPAVMTLPLPRQISALKVGDRLADAGFLLSYRSDYLLARNWVQICLMGQYTQETIDRMLQTLRRAALRQNTPAPTPSPSQELAGAR